jgi:phosphoribosylformylglycinamidine cyclo-ligase
MVNITGHGWRKLMRATKDDLRYVIKDIPKPQPEFELIQKLSGMSDYDIYGTLNMGAGFAVFLPKAEAEHVFDIATKQQLKATIAGTVEKGEKSVIIEPKNIVFEASTLGVRR